MIRPTDEEYLEFARLSAELSIPAPLAGLTVEVANFKEKPRVAYDEISRSLVRNVHNFWCCLFIGHIASTGSYGAGGLRIKRVSGTTETCGTSAYSYLRFVGYAGSGNSAEGIVVGTGTTAESFEDTALASQIVHGTGTNQLVHQAVTTPDTYGYYDGGTKTWTQIHKRIFNNNGAATVAVQETGVYGRDPYWGASYIYLMFRDVLPSPINVTPGGQLTVTYTFSLVFPE